MTSRELATTSSERVISMWHIKLLNHKYSYFQSCRVGDSYYAVGQGCTNNGCQVSEVTKFCVMTRNIYGSSGWNLLHVTLLSPRILRGCYAYETFVHHCSRHNLVALHVMKGYFSYSYTTIFIM
jgi:hypothetical protein